MKNEVREFIVSKLAESASRKASEIPISENLIDAGILDSLAFLDLLTALELEFKTQIDFGDLDPNQFLTVQGLADYVVAGLQSAGAV